MVQGILANPICSLVGDQHTKVQKDFVAGESWMLNKARVKYHASISIQQVLGTVDGTIVACNS